MISSRRGHHRHSRLSTDRNAQRIKMHPYNFDAQCAVEGSRG
jgi:hypothetical protein